MVFFSLVRLCRRRSRKKSQDLSAQGLYQAWPLLSAHRGTSFLGPKKKRDLLWARMLVPRGSAPASSRSAKSGTRVFSILQ